MKGSNMRIYWVKSKYGGNYRACLNKQGNGPALAILMQNPYGRKFWEIEIDGIGIQDRAGNDCFSLSIAKQLAESLIDFSTIDQEVLERFAA